MVFYCQKGRVLRVTPGPHLLCTQIPSDVQPGDEVVLWYVAEGQRAIIRSLDLDPRTGNLTAVVDIEDLPLAGFQPFSSPFRPVGGK